MEQEERKEKQHMEKRGEGTTGGGECLPLRGPLTSPQFPGQI